MEYVANAKGETVLAASQSPAVQPASARANAATASPTILSAILAQSAAPAPVSLSKATKIIFAVSLIVAYVLGIVTKAIL